MNNLISFCALSVIVTLPLAVSAQETASTSALGSSRYLIVDASGEKVGELIALASPPYSSNAASERSVAVAPMHRISPVADYARALTPQDFADAERRAHDEFFDVSHAP